MKHLITIVLILVFNLCFAQCQDCINIYTPANDSLRTLLNEFIETEKSYDYYTDDCMFFMRIFCADSAIFFIVESGPSNQESFVADSAILWNQSFGDILILELDNHYFYTFLSSCANTELPLTRTEKIIHIKEIDSSSNSIEENLPSTGAEELFESLMIISYHNGKYEKLKHYYRTYGILEK